MVWETDRAITTANIVLRLIQSFIPLAMLYVGKEIVDEVIRLINSYLFRNNEPFDNLD